jgi:hypothetical protein
MIDLARVRFVVGYLQGNLLVACTPKTKPTETEGTFRCQWFRSVVPSRLLSYLRLLN